MSALLLVLAVTVAIAQMPAGPAAQRTSGLTEQRTSEPTVPVPAVPSVSGSIEPPQPSGPFQKLFTPQANAVHAQKQLRAALEQHRRAVERSAPKIVCGMVVLRADPAVDPKIIVPPPASSATMRIRKIPPPVCAE
jgi:hypothetical protein